MLLTKFALFSSLISAIPLSDSFGAGLSAAKNSTIVASVDINALKTKYQNYPWIKTSFMTCKSASVLDDTQAFSFPISCVLTTQPKSDVTVFFEAFGAKFSACFITFPLNDYNSPQSISIIPSLNLFPSAAPLALTIYAVASANLDNFSNQVYYWTVDIVNKAPAVCNIIGDPHIQTFDKVDNSMNNGANAFNAVDTNTLNPSHFVFKNVGAYTLIKSTRGLMVVGSYTPCWGVSCLSAVSIQYGQGLYIVTIDPTSLALVVKTSGNMAGSSCTPFTESSTLIVFTLDDGSTITIGGGSTMLIFTAIMAPVHYQKLSGHCNFWDSSIPANTLVSQNAQNVINDNSDAVIGAWGETWAVQTYPSNSLVNSVLNTVAPFGQQAMYQIQPTYCMIPKMDDLNSITTSDVAILIAQAQAQAASATKSMQDAIATQSYIAASILSYNNAQATATSIGLVQATQSMISASALSYNNAQATATLIQNAQATALSILNARKTSTLIAQAPTTTIASIPATIVTSPILIPTTQPRPSVKCSITRPQAQKYCKTAIQEVSGCKTLCSLSTYIETCTQDILASCGYYIVPSHRSAYLQVCGLKATLLVNHTNPVYADIGHQLTVTILEKKCAKSCPNGMSGTYCDVNLNKMFPGTSVLPQSVDVNAVNYVYSYDHSIEKITERKEKTDKDVGNSTYHQQANSLSGSMSIYVGQMVTLSFMSILLFV